MKADKAVEAVVEATETTVDTVAEKAVLLTPKNLIIAGVVVLGVTGVVIMVKRAYAAKAEYEAREAEETEE